MTNEEDLIKWNEYLIPNTNILKNKLGIVDNDELKSKEKDIVKRKLAYLYLKPIKGNFDISHLKKIHKFIFDDIYYFAGELRTCSLQKDAHVFCNPEDIESNLIELLNEMNEEFNNQIYSKEEFAFRLSKYYYNILYIHPFREGNGRCIRSFFRDFIVEKSKNKSCGNLDIDYTKIDKEKLMLGTAFKYIYPSYIEEEFMKGIINIESKDKNRKLV